MCLLYKVINMLLATEETRQHYKNVCIQGGHALINKNNPVLDIDTIKGTSSKSMHIYAPHFYVV